MTLKKTLFTSNCVIIFPSKTQHWHLVEIFFFSFPDVRVNVSKLL